MIYKSALTSKLAFFIVVNAIYMVFIVLLPIEYAKDAMKTHQTLFISCHGVIYSRKEELIELLLINTTLVIYIYVG